MRLDIGCGRSPLPNCTTVDLYWAADIHATMWDIPLPAECAEFINCSQALEHVGKYDVVPTLREWKRLLKPGGTINLEVPDLIWCCKNFISAPGPGRSLEVIFGYQGEPGEVHQTGFTEQMMRDYCQEVGLTIVEFWRVYKHEMDTLIFTIKK